MKFYDVPVWVCFGVSNKKNEIFYQKKSCGNIVVKKTFYECKEIVTDMNIIVEPSTQSIGFYEKIERKLYRNGFCFVIPEEYFQPKNYAKKETVSNYLEEYQQLEFYHMYNDKKHVFGLDKKEVKKKIIEYKRGNK